MPSKKITQIQSAALFAVLTVGSMALFFNFYEPWLPIGPDRINDGGFETPGCISEWTGWNNLTRRDSTAGYKNSAGFVLETSPKHHGTLRTVIAEVDHIPAIRVSARAKAENIQGGERGYHIPRVVFFYRDSSGKALYSRPHTVFGLKKDSRWKRYSNVFPVPEDVLDGRLYLQNIGAEGTLYLDDLSVIPVSPRPSTPFFQILFTILWIAAFSFCLLALTPWKSLTGIGSLLCALTIITGVIFPGEILDNAILRSAEALKQSMHRSKPAAQQEPVITLKNTQPEPTPVKKADSKRPTPKTKSPEDTLVGNVHVSGHFMLFLTLAALSVFTWAPPSKPTWFIGLTFVGLALFASATEVLQFTTPDRKPGFSDLFVDFYGILFAVIPLTFLTMPFRAKHRRTSENSRNP